MITQLDWFHQARLGMFIHWGVYSVQHNGEWVMAADHMNAADYRELVDQFTGTHFDADHWAKLASESGMRYVVLTTKHHDGFCLWDTATTDFNAVKIGPRRDVVREYVEACRRHGLRVGLYWSWVDWNYPQWYEQYWTLKMEAWRVPMSDPQAHDRLINYLHTQVRELMTAYGKIDIFWFDGGFLRAEHYRSQALVDEMRQLQPQMLINDRAGFPGDFGNPEGLMPTEGSQRAWELCHVSTAHCNWTAAMDDPALFLSPVELLALLSDAAGLGGNLLLNFGPESDGTFSPHHRQQLHAIGAWMQLNSSCIYATQAGPTGRQSWGVSTCQHRSQGHTVYLHLFRPSPKLEIRGLVGQLRSVRLLESSTTLNYETHDSSLVLHLPEARMPPQVVALDYAHKPDFIHEPPYQQPDGTIILTANQAVLRTTHADGQPQLFLSPDALGGRLLRWQRLEDFAEWTFTLHRSGRYRVSFEFNNPESLNCFARRVGITVAGQSLRASVAISGQHRRFDTYRLAGAFELTKGMHTLTAKPFLLDPGILMNLRAVVLTPAN